MNEKIPEILRQIETVVVGKNEIVEKILMAILAGGHVLMEDVPGVGKTTTAMTFAKVLGLDTKRVQFTSDTVPSDIIGYSVYDKESGSFVYKPGAVMTNLLLADEINRTSSKTQSALLEAMEELHVTVDGKTYELPQPFVVLATQNPVGSAGTQMLPPSQMDRFMIKISMGYPDFESQISILRDRHTENPLNRVTPVVDREQLQALIDQQVQMVLEMERKLFDSLKIGSLSCDMLIEDKEINDQTIRMELEFALKELVATLQPDSTELEQLPESCKLSMEIHNLIQQRNEEFAIEMPDLSQAVSIE